MKVLVYNILNGFCTEKIPYTLQEERMNSAIKIIKKDKQQEISKVLGEYILDEE